MILNGQSAFGLGRRPGNSTRNPPKVSAAGAPGDHAFRQFKTLAPAELRFRRHCPEDSIGAVKIALVRPSLAPTKKLPEASGACDAQVGIHDRDVMVQGDLDCRQSSIVRIVGLQAHVIVVNKDVTKDFSKSVRADVGAAAPKCVCCPQCVH